MFPHILACDYVLCGVPVLVTVCMFLPALFSVSNKSGLRELGEGLSKLGYKLLASGGTAKCLKAADLEVSEVQWWHPSHAGQKAVRIQSSEGFVYNLLIVGTK